MPILDGKWLSTCHRTILTLLPNSNSKLPFSISMLPMMVLFVSPFSKKIGLKWVVPIQSLMKFRTYLSTLTPRIPRTPKYFACLQITEFCTTKNVQNIYNSNHIKHRESSLMPSSNFNSKSAILIEWSWLISLAFKTIWNSPYHQT